MKWYVAPSYQNGTLEKVKEEERKGLVVERCDRCGGTGAYVIPGIFSGMCFQCSGTGYTSKWVKIYTEEEYNKYLKTQEKAKERRVAKEVARKADLEANSEKNLKEHLVNFGFDPENPCVYLIAGGNTYEIKDIIKECGGRYNPALNWYFTAETELPDGYQLVKLPWDEFYEWNPLTKKSFLKEGAKECADAARRSIEPESDSEWIGNIKERMRDLRVTLTGAREVESAYGISTLFTFELGKNILIWFASNPPSLTIGQEYYLTGTVVEHKEYNGVKQTRVNRCKLAAA